MLIDALVADVKGVKAVGGSSRTAMKADCPNCKGFVTQGRCTLFREGGDVAGLTHAIPDMWLIGRSSRLAKDESLNAHESHLAAMRQFAWACSMENR